MDEQKVINAVETFLEGAEDTVEVLVPEVAKRARFVTNNKLVLVGTAIVSLGAGVAIGYKVAKKRLEPKYEALARDEIREAQEHYKKLSAKSEYPTPADAVAALIPEEAQEALEQYQGKPRTVGRVVEITEDEHGLHVKAQRDEEVQEVQHRNIFVNGAPLNADEWDYDVELEQRNEDKPYIIHEDEFNENEPDFEDMVLTYYSADGVLTNDQDEIVDDVEGLVGSRNLKKFGHGSSDKNMLFIRNHRRGLNIEISRSMGSYSKEVLNYDEDDDPQPRKRNRGDGDE